jgi:hypothetical protein
MFDFSNYIDMEIPLECPNHDKTVNARIIITPHSIKITCRECPRYWFYRVVKKE